MHNHSKDIYNTIVMYDKRVIEHFTNPRHAGSMEDADAVGQIGDPNCGDYMRVYIKCKNDCIEEISFLCQGCPAAVACGSATTELASGKTLEEAMALTEKQVSDHLGGLPGNKMHCSNLGVGALRRAIAEYTGTDVAEEHEFEEELPVLEKFRRRLEHLCEDLGILDEDVDVQVRGLSTEEAIGNPKDRDYPIIKGKEVMVEARFQTGVGQAFTSTPSDFAGKVADVLALDIEGESKEASQNRAVLVATGNAIAAHADLTVSSIHCKNEDPVECATVLAETIMWLMGEPKIALFGFQPRMLEELAKTYRVRCVDLDPENIGQTKFGIDIEPAEKTDEVLDWCDFALVTGSTLANNTMDRFLAQPKRVIFYGVTNAGAEALLGISRFCPRGK